MKVIYCNCLTKTPEFQYHEKSCPHRISKENEILLEALSVYAKRKHMLGQFDDFDSVSGEPLNMLWHDELPFGVENGSVARYAIERINKE